MSISVQYSVFQIIVVDWLWAFPACMLWARVAVVGYVFSSDWGPAFCRSYRHFWVVGLLRHFLDLLQTLSILCAFKSHTNIDIMIKILENRKKRKRQRRKPCQRRYGPRRWLLLPIWLIFCIFSNFAHFTYFAYFICPAYSAYFAYFAHFTTNASIDRVS